MTVPRIFQWLNPRRALLGILVIQLILSLAYVFSIPLWQGHEQDFFTVVRFMAQHGRIPTAADYPDGNAEIHQATQPPLYFLTAYPVVALLDDNQMVPPGRHPDLICVGDDGANTTVIPYPISAEYLTPWKGAVAAGYGLRLLNGLIGLATTVLTFAAARTPFPNKPAIAVVATALIAFEPNIVRLNSTINNDTLLIALSAANLLLCGRLAAHFTPKTLLLLLVTVLLALFTRLGGWALLAFDLLFVLVIGLVVWRGSLRAHLRGILLGIGLLIVVGIAVLVFNRMTYGSFLGRYSTLEDSIAGMLNNFKSPWVPIIGVLNLTYAAYQEPLQALAPRALFTRIYGLLLLVSLIGAGWALLRAIHRRSEIRSLLILLGMALVAVLLVIFRNILSATVENTTLYNTGFIFAPIRYYAPGLPALAVLFSAGLASLLPERFAKLNLLGIAVAGCWLIVTVVGGGREITRQSRPHPLSLEEFAALPGLTQLETAQTEDTPQFLAYTIREHPAEIDLTLYLSTNQPLTLNYAVQLEINPSGVCQFLPAHGTYPTTLWQSGEIFVIEATVPNCAAQTSATSSLRLNWLGANQDGEITEESPPLELITLQSALQKSVSCPANPGIIAGGYQIATFNSPPTVHVDEQYLPSVNWTVIKPVAGAVARTFVFTHAETGATYSCTGASADIYDVASWRRGQQVYFDICPFRFPAAAPLGVYRVAVGIRDAEGNYLPAVSSGGEPVADGLITVGEVTLTR